MTLMKAIARHQWVATVFALATLALLLFTLGAPFEHGG